MKLRMKFFFFFFLDCVSSTAPASFVGKAVFFHWIAFWLSKISWQSSVDLFWVFCSVPLIVYLTLCYYPCLYLNWVVCFFVFEFWEFILYPAHKSFVESVVCIYFLSFCSLSFHDLDSVFLQNKSFKFGWPTTYHFFLLWIMIWCHL